MHNLHNTYTKIRCLKFRQIMQKIFYIPNKRLTEITIWLLGVSLSLSELSLINLSWLNRKSAYVIVLWFLCLAPYRCGLLLLPDRGLNFHHSDMLPVKWFQHHPIFMFSPSRALTHPIPTRTENKTHIIRILRLL